MQIITATELRNIRGRHETDCCSSPQVLGADINALIKALDRVQWVLSNILRAPADCGPCHHGWKEGYEWYGRSENTWEDARQALIDTGGGEG